MPSVLVRIVVILSLFKLSKPSAQVLLEMSLDQVKPQGYAVIRVKESQVVRFFQDLKDRKLVRGDNLSTYKITDKPLESSKPIQTHTGAIITVGSSSSKSKATSKVKGSTKRPSTSAGGSSTVKKHKTVLEKRLVKAKL